MPTENSTQARSKENDSLGRFVQGDLFTRALDNKSRALDLVQRFHLSEARDELGTALEIDPYLADLRTLIVAVDLLRNGNASNLSTAPDLALLWRKFHDQKETFPIPVWQLVEQWLCERIVELCGDEYCDYVSAESRLHSGYCRLILGQPDQAYRLLLEFISKQKKVRAQLWSYFGDASTDLDRPSEANVGYLHALFTAPWQIDFTTLRHKGILAIHRHLAVTLDSREALALLPIKCWFAGIIYIPERAKWIPDLVNEIHNSEWEADVTSYREFSICLLLDQAGSSDSESNALRARMKTLLPGLFREYLENLPGESS